jgi:hypothetical protein
MSDAETDLAPAPEAVAYNPPPIEKKKKSGRKKKDVEIAIRLTKVTKRFGAKTAVDEVSLKVKSGAVYGPISP